MYPTTSGRLCKHLDQGGPASGPVPMPTARPDLEDLRVARTPSAVATAGDRVTLLALRSALQRLDRPPQLVDVLGTDGPAGLRPLGVEADRLICRVVRLPQRLPQFRHVHRRDRCGVGLEGRIDPQGWGQSVRHAQSVDALAQFGEVKP